jgi:hypothetical protein
MAMHHPDNEGRLVGGAIATQAALVSTADSCKEMDSE